MAILNDRSGVLEFLRSRKSGSAKAMGPPGPAVEELDELLAIATRAPDHGKLTPWRLVIFEGEARAEIGRRFARRWQALHPQHGEDMLAFQRGLFQRAPLVIAVISAAQAHPKIPEWEQQLSAAAVAYNLTLAATAMGYAAQWQTDWVAYDEGSRAIIGCGPSEKIAGIVYIGTPTAALEERPRPDISAIAARWSG